MSYLLLFESGGTYTQVAQIIFSDHEQIYIVGGFNGQEVLSSAEMFDPRTGQWSFIRSMLSPRSGVSLIAYRDSLYALGGFNGYSRLNSGKWYNFKVNRCHALFRCTIIQYFRMVHNTAISTINLIADDRIIIFVG